MTPRRVSGSVCLLLALLASGCAEPPNKEMDQAQGAIDAARAAGADQYATTEYSAATDALKNAHEAVVVRDYRLALNHALESREHAQNAARDAAESKARVRADVEREATQVAALLTTARSRIATARTRRVPARAVRQASASVASAEAALQRSGEAVAAGNYLAASAALEGVRAAVVSTIEAMNGPTPTRTPQRRS